MLAAIIWFRELIRERLLTGSQNCFIVVSLKLGIIFFILSEIFFFISFFWRYSHFIFSQSGELGMCWIPVGLLPVDYKRIPLLNSLLLLTRGVSLTVAHNSLSMGFKSYNIFLFFTILLGLLFTYCQYWEYKILDFIWSDCCFSSIFFMGTGFHGLHVVVGSIILIVIYIRRLNIIILFDSIIFELGAWYWHFVDVVWIILFTEFYWWRYLNKSVIKALLILN